MTEAFKFQPGWTYDEKKIAAATARMESAGYTVKFDADRPQLKGCWERMKGRGFTRVLAQDAELKVCGKWRDTNTQARGTCVGQGHSRGIEDTHIARLASKAIVGVYSPIVYEVMYGESRHEHCGQTHQWGCNCGQCPDGLAGSDAAAWYTTHGALARRMYGKIDLTTPQERYAIEWNNSGAPAELIAASAFHKLIAHSSDTWNDYADAISSEHYGAICLPKIVSGSKQDHDGCCEPDGDGGHCTECCGVVVLPNGETGFIIQQSWPLGAVHYPAKVNTKNDWIQLRPGSYAMRQSSLENISRQYRDRVERHSYDIPPASSFR